MAGYLVVCATAWVVAGAVAWRGRARARRRWMLASTSPDALLDSDDDGGAFRTAVVLVGLGLILTIFVSAAAPIGSLAGRIRLLSPIGAASALALGSAGFSLLSGRFDWAVADVSMGLLTAGMVACGLLFVPPAGGRLDAQLPMMLTACMTALSVASGFWVWLGGVWRQQIAPDGCWTVAGSLVPVTQRMGFVSACLAVLLGLLIACWPVLWMVGTADDSAGRVASSTGAHLVLLLVLMRNFRTLRRRSFVVLGVWTVVSLVLLIGVRSGPWASVVVPASGPA